MLNKLRNRLNEDKGNAILIWGLMGVVIILLVAGFVVDLSKNFYLSHEYNNMANTAVMAGIRKQDGRGSLDPGPATYTAVSEYLKERNSAQCKTPKGEYTPCRTNNTNVWRAASHQKDGRNLSGKMIVRLIATKKVTTNGKTTIEDDGYVEYLFSLDDSIGSDGAESSDPILSNVDALANKAEAGIMDQIARANPKAHFTDIQILTQEEAPNYFLSIFSKKMQTSKIGVSKRGTAVRADRGLVGD